MKIHVLCQQKTGTICKSLIKLLRFFGRFERTEHIGLNDENKMKNEEDSLIHVK